MAICTHEELLTMRCGRGLTRGVVSVRRVVCYGRGFVGVAFADNQQSLSLFCSLKKVFFEGKDTQKHRTRWVGETW